MGCTVSGVEKRNCEWFVCGQEKSIIKAIKAPSGSNSLQFSTCGKELEQSSLKSNEKSDELGESTILRSTHSGRNFSSKMFEELPSIKGSSNSNEIDARVTLFKNLNKDPFAMDRTGNTSYLKGTTEFVYSVFLKAFMIVKHSYITDKLRTALATIFLLKGSSDGVKLARKNTASTTFRTIEPTPGEIPICRLRIAFSLFIYLSIYQFIYFIY